MTKQKEQQFSGTPWDSKLTVTRLGFHWTFRVRTDKSGNDARVTLKFESPEWLLYLLMDLWVPLAAKLRAPVRRLRARVRHRRVKRAGPGQGPK